MRCSPLLLKIALLFLVGCTALGLDDLETAHCEQDLECAFLAQGSSPCQVFRCDQDSGRCVEQTLDHDGDGEPSTDCGGQDCDDSAAAIGPHASEVCGNAVDEDCDGMATDMDCDGEVSQEQGGEDCNDHDETVGPHAAEICNGVDDDCNGLLDGPDEDDDGDGHADTCAGAASDDCDDNDASTYVGALEICDGLDNDCFLDGFVRLGGGPHPELSEDRDGDGHSASDADCDDSSEGAYPADDCDDADDAVHPGAFEHCDGLDNDCDGLPDNLPGATDLGGACLPIEVAAGGSHSCVRHRNDEVVCWGSNFAGELGDASAPDDAAIVVRSVEGIVDLESGTDFTCGLHDDAGVICWGRETILYAFDDVRAANVGTVGRVADLEGVAQIAAGRGHACARLETGHVRCWGNGSEISLDGLTSSFRSSFLPVELQNLDDALDVDAGSSLSCAARATGGVTCWGVNFAGQLGAEGGGLLRADVTDLGDAQEVACGGSFGCARLSDGRVFCWGANDHGQLGCGSCVAGPTPRQVHGITDAVEIAAGSAFACARLVSGEVRCWGRNHNGQLGNGGTEESRTPVSVHHIDDASSLSLGSAHGCVMRPEGVACWGSGAQRQAGTGWTEDLLEPTAVSVLANAVQITGGRENTCFRLPHRQVRCVGADGFGQLGGILVPSATPRNGFDIDDAIDVGQGARHSCVLRATGEARCFGYNYVGQLGSQNADEPVTGIDDGSAIACGDFHCCLLRAAGNVSCWGLADDGQLGPDAESLERCESSSYCSFVPLDVGLSGGVAIVAGSDHSCLLHDDGTISCWGSNLFGQVGSLPTGVARTPRQVEGLPGLAVGLAAGGESTCALLVGGDVFCWGAELTAAASPAWAADPWQVLGLTNVVELAMTARSGCARAASGRVRCFGGNEHGELGDGTTEDRLLPVNVLSLSDARTIGCGDAHCCATRTSGQSVCWGRGRTGQLASPDLVDMPTPTSTVDMLRL